MQYKQKIIELRKQGKSYNEIVSILGCVKSTVAYHCGDNQRQKYKARNRKYRAKHPFILKTNSFNSEQPTKVVRKNQTTIRELFYKKVHRFNGRTMKDAKVSVEDAINKFNQNPKCYLTGEPIDITKPRTYQFDHIVPVSRGGSNTIENLGFCTKRANQSKNDMTHDEYVDFCKKVLEHHGYQVSKVV